MPKLSQSKTKLALSPALAAHQLMTLDEAALAAGISRRGLLNLRKKGEGPDLTRFGSSVRLSQELFAAWQRRMTERVAS